MLNNTPSIGSPGIRRGDRLGDDMKIIYAVTFFAALAMPGAAFAGFGAIAYNPATSASSEAHGYPSQAAAEQAALGACAGACQIVNWEENTCNALALGPGGTWGEGHGYPDQNAALAAALSTCGADCKWQEWTCN